MRPTHVAISLFACLPLAWAVQAQQPAPAARDTAARPAAAAPAPTPREESSVTEHTIRIGGQVIPYRATAATLLLKDDKNEPIGSLYYTAYTRTDVRDASQRPLAFVYNGGPGAASAWLHMGAFGPRRIVTTDAAPTPPPPYRLVDNASSLIDVADLVFIDPIGTGFSRPVGRGAGKDFWGVDEDARSLTQFVAQYVSRNGRWNSPKYLIGESYGTTRSAVLVNLLQQREGMDFMELQRSRGLITGRLDSRFSGPAFDLLSENAEYDPQSRAVTGAYTAAINAYLRDDLRLVTELRYNVSASGLDWNFNREGSRGRSATYVGGDLAQALVAKPNLRVEVENGYYDMATPFFATEYTMDHLGLPANLRSRIDLKYYEAGHMMYLYEPALGRLKLNIAQFIAATSHGQ